MLRASVLVPVYSNKSTQSTLPSTIPTTRGAGAAGDLLGVEMGRRVRNAREFAEALAVVMEEEKTRKKKKKKKKKKDGAG